VGTEVGLDGSSGRSLRKFFYNLLLAELEAKNHSGPALHHGKNRERRRGGERGRGTLRKAGMKRSLESIGEGEKHS